MTGSRIPLNLAPRRTRDVLLVVLAVLGSLDLLLVLFEYGFGIDVPFPVESRLDSNSEASLPTLYNVALLFLASAASAVAGRVGSHRWAWRLMCAAFGFLALDEALAIHEGIGPRVGALLGTSNVAWVLPYAIACLGLLLIILPWLRSLPPRILRGFLVSGAIYLIGAMGLDALTHVVLPLFPDGGSVDYDLFHGVVTGVEEMLEMLGVILFLYFVLVFLRSVTAGLDVTFEDGAGA